ncbi:MAG: pilus assembly protein PilM [Planctomycetaceae bacterium]|nr:pilus assembly protein PilM [Planctomycetaceae bacterium]
MAGGAVWGIDIGQCALKALRCSAHEDPDKVVAEAFDYIEYPKILSQSGSDPAELIGDAMQQFLSRNSVLGDRVAVSVPGQAGLARFIKLPPVEAKKIPDIVRYEARQQIPFDLNDVVWDYQRMGGGSVEEGFALETEVGLFAMKRDAVFRSLAPFLKADVEVDVVQLTPLVLYNFLLFDRLGELPSPDEYDPENPPESTVMIAMGTDATDLVITNGFRVWQRSIPIGGSHFTKALVRELKLTFAKAEHLKRNATAAADPKAVFQAMRPVFNDLLTELQRSIGYFSNLNRADTIGPVVALGNAMKLPGLRRYLSQSLGYDIQKVDSYRGLIGSQVLTAPSFQENLLSFGVCYGLCLQGLGKGGVHTNLLPKEIVNERLIKRKKPWAVAAAAVLLLAFCVHYAASSLALNTVSANSWTAAEGQAKRLSGEFSRLKSEYEQARNEYKATDEIGQHLVGNAEARLQWLELLKAINSSLPESQPDDPKAAADPAKSIPAREELHVTSVDAQRLDDVATWYTNAKRWEDSVPAAPAGGTPAGAPGAPPAAGAPGGDPAGGPKGPGWIVQISGYHYHNAVQGNQGAQYVRNTLIAQLRKGKLQLPAGDGEKLETVTMAELGVSSPLLIDPRAVHDDELTDPNADLRTAKASDQGNAEQRNGAIGNATAKDKRDDSSHGTIRVKRFDFVVQFCWQPKSPSERRAAKSSQSKPNG